MRQTRHRGRRRVGWMFVFSLAVYTVARYRVWARRHGVLDGGPLPDAAALAGLLMPAPTERPAHEQSLVEPLRELALRERGVEGQAIWQLLVEEHGFTGSYSSVKRFLRRLAPAHGRGTLRIDVEPGDEAQVDFGLMTHGAHFVEITGHSFRAEHTKKQLTARRSRGASAA